MRLLCYQSESRQTGQWTFRVRLLMIRPEQAFWEYAIRTFKQPDTKATGRGGLPSDFASAHC